MGLNMKTQLITSTVLMISSNLSWGSFALEECNDAWPGKLISDHDNCRNYYICAEDGDTDPTLGLCSDGGCFNPDVGSCEDTDSEYCMSSCIEVSGQTTASTTQTTSTTPTSTTEQTTATTPITVTTPITIRTPNTASTPTIASTPITASTSITTSTPTITISLTTKPTTKTPVMCGNDIQGTVKPDPTDCRKFFICTSAGQWFLLPCLEDSCFVEDLHTCYGNADFCIGLCGDVPVTSTATTPTTSTDTPADCIDINNFVCPKKGYFAKCNYCTQEYFSCSRYGAMPVERKCSGSLMFNPDPAYPYCVLPENCH